MMKKILGVLVVAALVPALIYVGATIAYQFGAIGFGDVFGLLNAEKRYLSLVPYMLLGAGILLVAGIASFPLGRPGLGIAAVLLAVPVGLIGYGPIKMEEMVGSVPAIHDITTDTEDPPSFVVTAAERTEKENPAAYDRGQTEAQLNHYKDIKPIELQADRETAFAAARSALKSMGIEIKYEDAPRIVEGTATTFWFRFKDDVVVRLEPMPDGGTVVDIRSKSRFGRSDLGTNAKRIKTIEKKIRNAVGE